MIKYIKYLLVFLLATGFVACSEDEGAQILGSLYEKGFSCSIQAFHSVCFRPSPSNPCCFNACFIDLTTDEAISRMLETVPAPSLGA